LQPARRGPRHADTPSGRRPRAAAWSGPTAPGACQAPRM